MSVIVAEHKWSENIKNAIDDNDSLMKYYELPLEYVIRPFLKEVVYFKQIKVSILANYTNPEVLEELVSVEKEGLYSVLFYYEVIRAAQLAESPPQLIYRNDEPLPEDSNRNLQESTRHMGDEQRQKVIGNNRMLKIDDAKGIAVQGKIVFRNTSGYLSAEYFNLLFFYQLSFAFFAILLISSAINHRQFSKSTRAHFMLGILTVLSCAECIFACLYWYETNE